MSALPCFFFMHCFIFSKPFFFLPWLNSDHEILLRGLIQKAWSKTIKVKEKETIKFIGLKARSWAIQSLCQPWPLQRWNKSLLTSHWYFSTIHQKDVSHIQGDRLQLLRVMFVCYWMLASLVNQSILPGWCEELWILSTFFLLFKNDSLDSNSRLTACKVQ